MNILARFLIWFRPLKLSYRVQAEHLNKSNYFSYKSILPAKFFTKTTTIEEKGFIFFLFNR